MKKSKLKMVSLTGMLICGLSVTTAFAGNNVSSKVWSEKSANKVRASGWVSMINDDGNGKYHYSNAQIKSGSTVWAESGRKWGTGTVSATSGYTPNSGIAKIYYGY